MKGGHSGNDKARNWLLKIEEEVYVCQPPRFEDPHFPNKVYKVSKAQWDYIKPQEHGMRHCQPTCWTMVFTGDKLTKLCSLEDIKMISCYQDKYVAEILKKFDLASIKTASTPMETNKPLTKDEEAENVDVPSYSKDLTPSSSEGGSLGNPQHEVSIFGKRLISWQCKKQTIVANSTTEAEYVAAANCCRQVLWIQNQMLDYGYNLMNTNIYIDNESTICIVKNPVSHSKTKHIEIRSLISGFDERRRYK
ncbi:hypothetical protein Tco_0991217 [Tanacetum coccineum]|uniref:Uncharacterized protein n=1 Tax=Tanacetum coccineum TaxID=301880 RepID=A0ABQ5EZF0_9ASTR